MLVRRLGDGGRLLDVVGHDDGGHGPLGQCDPARAVDQMTDLSGLHRHLHELVRHVLEQRRQVDLLLVVPAQAGARLLADDRHYRLVIELGVIQPVEQMDGPGARGGHADPELVRELRVGAGHECRHLLVADLDELRALAVR